MKNIIKSIAPSLTAWIVMFFIPIALIIYFVASEFSNQFIAEGGLSFQQQWFELILKSQQAAESLSRFMDFAFWGILAFVIILISWAITNTKISVKNHYKQQSFVNFKTSKSTWHSRFYIVFAIKILLGLLVLFSIFKLIGNQAQALGTATNELSGVLNSSSLANIILAFCLFLIFELVIVSGIKTIRNLSLN